MLSIYKTLAGNYEVISSDGVNSDVVLLNSTNIDDCLTLFKQTILEQNKIALYTYDPLHCTVSDLTGSAPVTTNSKEFCGVK